MIMKEKFREQKLLNIYNRKIFEGMIVISTYYFRENA